MAKRIPIAACAFAYDKLQCTDLIERFAHTRFFQRRSGAEHRKAKTATDDRGTQTTPPVRRDSRSHALQQRGGKGFGDRHRLSIAPRRTPRHGERPRQTRS